MGNHSSRPEVKSASWQRSSHRIAHARPPGTVEVTNWVGQSFPC